MSIDKARKRLRSWWCKPAAAIIAPYDEVMIVDLDVIFFKNPEILFTAKGEYIVRSIVYIVLSLAYYCLPCMPCICCLCRVSRYRSTLLSRPLVYSRTATFRATKAGCITHIRR